MRQNIGNTALICGAAAVILAAIAIFLSLTANNSTEVTIGTYGDNIYLYSFDNESLEFTLKAQAEAKNASYALSCKGDEAGMNIFSVSETGETSGAYSFRKKVLSFGTRLNQTAVKLQTGADPCFLMLFDDNKYLFTADYSGGSISIFPINDGVLGECSQQLCFEGEGPIKGRQESSHIHQLKQVPAQEGLDGDWIIASDLGADCLRLLYVSRISSMVHGEDIMPVHVGDIQCPRGSGPRHMEFSKDGKNLYCIAELSGDVLVYDVYPEECAPNFSLKQQIQADELNAGGSADIHIHPSGKWLYTSHRLENDGIATFRILEDGRLEKTAYTNTARHPRNFMITEDGKFMLVTCRDDKLVQVFRINEDGGLEQTSSVLKFDSDRPSSITSY